LSTAHERRADSGDPRATIRLHGGGDALRVPAADHVELDFGSGLVGPGGAVTEERGGDAERREERDQPNLHFGPSFLRIAGQSERSELTK
jgi:hypothetical protein